MEDVVWRLVLQTVDARVVQVHTLTSVVMITYMILPAPIVTAAWLGGLAVYYGVTSYNHPEHTGGPQVHLYIRAVFKAC